MFDFNNKNYYLLLQKVNDNITKVVFELNHSGKGNALF